MTQLYRKDTEPLYHSFYVLTSINSFQYLSIPYNAFIAFLMLQWFWLKKLTFISSQNKQGKIVHCIKYYYSNLVFSFSLANCLRSIWSTKCFTLCGVKEQSASKTDKILYKSFRWLIVGIIYSFWKQAKIDSQVLKAKVPSCPKRTIKTVVEE